MSAYIHPDWDPHGERYKYVGTIFVYFNSRYDEIGSACDIDFDDYDARTPANICSTGSLTHPTEDIETLTTRVGEAEPVIYTLPAVQDTGSIENGDATGLTSCGDRVYSLEGNESFLTINDRELTLQTTDNQDEGYHIVEVTVSLANYPEVESITVNVPVQIEACQIVDFVNPDDTIVSPINLVLNLPYADSIDMPLYEPSPLCGYSNQDVSYQLTTDTDG